MNKLSGIKISHKISSMMIGLIVGFVLMGVAYYAQISVDIKQQKTEQQFSQAALHLDKLLESQAEVKSKVADYLQSGKNEELQNVQGAFASMQLALDALAKVDFRFYSSSANDAVLKSAANFKQVFEQSLPAAVNQGVAAQAGTPTDSEASNAGLLGLTAQLQKLVQRNDAATNQLLRAELHHAEFLRTNDSLHAERFRDAVAQLDGSINNLTLALDDKQQANTLVARYLQAFNEMSTRLSTASERRQVQGDASQSLVKAVENYRVSMQQSLTRRIEAGEGEKSVAQWMFAVVLFLTAVGTTLGLFLIYRSIVLPLWHMQSIIAQQNRGNDKARVRIVANDELGNLGRAFNRLLDERIQVLSEKSLENEQLNNSIIGLIRALGMIARKDLSIKVPVSADVTGTVSDAVNLLTSETARTLHQVRSFSEKINEISDQLQSQSEIVMAVAAAERIQVAETVAALDQSAKTMNDIAREARVTNSIASAAIDNTLKAQESVTQTVEGIQVIRSTISETEKRIKRLGDRSQEITGIVNLINTIAERTHILALNASMHAASAGEAGKGFAVVAEEVQRLAENARGATSEISAMVNNIRVETSDTVNIMNKLITQVAEGTKLAEDSGQRMHETEAATRQLVNHVKSIAVNSVNQSTMSNRVRDRAITITESTEKTHSALEEQRLQTDELKDCARALQERVNVFTLPEYRLDARNTLVAIRQPAVNEDHMDEKLVSA